MQHAAYRVAQSGAVQLVSLTQFKLYLRSLISLAEINKGRGGGGNRSTRRTSTPSPSPRRRRASENVTYWSLKSQDPSEPQTCTLAVVAGARRDDALVLSPRVNISLLLHECAFRYLNISFRHIHQPVKLFSMTVSLIPYHMVIGLWPFPKLDHGSPTCQQWRKVMKSIPWTRLSPGEASQKIWSDSDCINWWPASPGNDSLDI